MSPISADSLRRLLPLTETGSAIVPDRPVSPKNPKCLEQSGARRYPAPLRWASSIQRMSMRSVVTSIIACLALFFAVSKIASAQVTAAPGLPLPQGIAAGPEYWTSPEGLSSTLQVMLLLTVISLAPAVLLMKTCFVRIIVVLGLLRQALGTQQLPPSQVITSIALFMTLLVMTPVWKKVYDDAIVPYTNKQITL